FQVGDDHAGADALQPPDPVAPLALAHRGRGLRRSAGKRATGASPVFPVGAAMNPGRRARATIALAAGGTGGHLFPAEALARELMARGHDVVIHTERRGAQYAQALQGIAHVVLPASPIGGGVAGKLRSSWTILRGVLAAR